MYFENTESMSSRTIKFEVNEPTTIALMSKTGLPFKGDYGWQTIYVCVDGSRFYASDSLNARIQSFEVNAGECFAICKRKQGRNVLWDLWLAPASEKARAIEEAPAVAAELAKPSNIVPMPEPIELAPTGTEGRAVPMPRRSIALTPPSSNRIPFNVAFLEVVKFVSAGLKESGEQWNDEARQGAVSTALISASQAGWIGPWEREG